MRKNSLLLSLLVFAAIAGATPPPEGLVLVTGGTRKLTKGGATESSVTLPDFYLGRCEVTQRDWVEVMGSNPATFRGDSLPVETVSWYDCIEYCNRRSLREGLQPCYAIAQSAPGPAGGGDDAEPACTVTLRAGANGYRLPTEAEWEYAATGGQLTKGYAYSGSDTLERVAWFWQNAGDTPLHGLWNWPAVEQNRTRTHPVGTKEPNELGLHDLSGNVREWCWDVFEPATATSPPGVREELRVWKGGGWIGGDFCCAPTFRAGFEPGGRGADQGFRVCRNR